MGTEDSDLYVRPGGAVAGEHVHPVIHESFTVVRGQVGFRLDGHDSEAGPGKRLHIPSGMVHDWWNAGDEEAHVVVEIRPGARFEDMPPRAVQKALFAILAPIARSLGYKGNYPEYPNRQPSEVLEVEPWPERESGSSVSEPHQQ